MEGLEGHRMRMCKSTTGSLKNAMTASSVAERFFYCLLPIEAMN